MAAPSESPSTSRRWIPGRAKAAAEPPGILRQMIAEAQPRFWNAVVTDARVTASYRREPSDFRNRADALRTVLRLMWVTEAFFAQVCYRAKVACQLRGIKVLPSLLHHLSVMSGQVVIGDRAVLEPGIYIPHGQVVIDGVTFLGTGVVVRPFVTLGLGEGAPIGPRIGAHTKIGTGAKIFGAVVIGDNVEIGANAVVLSDLPDGVTAVGVPARIVGT